MIKDDRMCMPPFLSDAQQLTAETYRQLFMRMYRVAVNSVRWDNLPGGTKQMLIERQLFYTGASVFFYDDILGQYLTLPVSGQYAWDENGLPTEYEVHGFRDYRRRLNIDNSVLIYNDYDLNPTSGMAQILCSRLTDSLRTCDVHLEKHKIGKIIAAPQQQKKGIQKLLEKIKGYEMYQVVSPDAREYMGNIVSLDTEMDSILGDLDSHYIFLWHDALSYFGITSLTSKLSGMPTEEIRSDNGLAEVDRTAIMNPRLDACEKINNMFGLNVKVRFYKEGDEIDGGVYDNSQRDDGGADRKDRTSEVQ